MSQIVTRWKCDRCGLRLQNVLLPVRHDCGGERRKAATATPCIHLGDEIDRIRCQSCRGAVWLKVHSCDLHGSCTLRKKAEGVPAVCSGCDDYAAAEGT